MSQPLNPFFLPSRHFTFLPGQPLVCTRDEDGTLTPVAELIGAQVTIPPGDAGACHTGVIVSGYRKLDKPDHPHEAPVCEYEPLNVKGRFPVRAQKLSVPITESPTRMTRRDRRNNRYPAAQPVLATSDSPDSIFTQTLQDLQTRTPDSTMHRHMEQQIRRTEFAWRSATLGSYEREKLAERREGLVEVAHLVEEAIALGSDFELPPEAYRSKPCHDTRTPTNIISDRPSERDDWDAVKNSRVSPEDEYHSP